MRPDVTALREAIDARLRAKATFSEQTYGDAPILFSGRTLKSFVPEPIAEARALARSPEMAYHGEAYVFWRQAHLLAGFEDEFDFRGHFSRYFPTYEVMSNEQLRGYFSWRTRWRRGEAAPTETSFVYVLAYELLHGIGVAGAEEGHAALGRLRAEYGEADPRMARTLTSWMDDYVVYWGLPSALLGPLAHREEDEALGVLLAGGADDERLFAALMRLSAYRAGSSALYKHDRALFVRVACAAWRTMEAHHAKLKRTLVETFFGTSTELDYALLPNAVFADPRPQEGSVYEVSPLDHIRRRGGLWARDRYAGNLRPNKRLGALLKTVDALVREVVGFEPALEAPLSTKYLCDAIGKAARAVLAEREEAERRAVRIDLSQLGRIRAAADLTRDRLIVEEDEGPASPSRVIPSEPADGASPSRVIPSEPANGASPSRVIPSEASPGGASGVEGPPAALHRHDPDLRRCGVEGDLSAPAAAQPPLRMTRGEAAAANAGPVTQEAAAAMPATREVAATPVVQAAAAMPATGEGDAALAMPWEAAAAVPASPADALTQDERSLLALVLEGGDIRAWEREHRVMAQVAIDSLNESLMDVIGDVAIDAGAEPPEVFEDYRDDVRELLYGA